MTQVNTHARQATELTWDAATLPDGSPCAGQLVIELGYQGQAFCGFVLQPGGIPTVAGDLERALQTMFRRPVHIVCSGRTDAGVHALGQMVSVPCTSQELERSEKSLVNGLVALTSPEISIRRIYRATPQFSARFSTIDRSYRYHICAGPAAPVLLAGRAWHVRQLLDDEAVARMHEAAQQLVGEHDFKSFCKAASAVDKNTVRTIHELRVSSLELDGRERIVAIDITGNAFLHNMVRIIVGSLVEIGRGARPVSWLAQALADKNRASAGPSAPPEGLVFLQARYAPTDLKPW